MKLPIQKGKEVIFQKVSPQQGFTLENQERKLADIRDIDVEDYLEDMFDSPDDLVILTASEAQNKIRYVQACTHDGDIEVELGVEDEEGTHLYYKMCTQEECYCIFLDFYDNTFVPVMEEYKPVEFQGFIWDILVVNQAVFYIGVWVICGN